MWLLTNGVVDTVVVICTLTVNFNEREKLCKGTVTERDGLKYTLIDSESLC